MAIIPSLTLGLFAVPALAGNTGVDTDINVTNVNAAHVSNTVMTVANTGGNRANGGNGGNGGASANIGTVGGDSDEAEADADGGNGGDADLVVNSRRGQASDPVGGDGGAAEAGAESGDGGNATAKSEGGNGGNGGNGGRIETGNAVVEVGIANEVNTNNTKVVVEDCGCDQYNETYEKADSYYEEWSKETENDRKDRGHHYNKGGDKETDEYYEESDKHWEKYTKEYVPVSTEVNVAHMNLASVDNVVLTGVNTGLNVADGGNGGDGGASANLLTKAGDADKADADAEGGNGGDAFSNANAYTAGGNGGYAGAVAFSGNGGDATAESDGGDGGNGGNGGVIVTGYASTLTPIVNVVNKNVTRIRR